jgi:hypothetical protein
MVGVHVTMDIMVKNLKIIKILLLSQLEIKLILSGLAHHANMFAKNANILEIRLKDINAQCAKTLNRNIDKIKYLYVTAKMDIKKIGC